MKNTIKLEGAAKRLDEFITSTSMNYSEFSRQCGLKHPKNILAVCRQGQQPTGKLMDKILLRFPQLNYDWVMLGYGEMIIKGLQNQPSVESVRKSRDATYDNIKEYLENHDYALNYLANKIEKALVSSTKTFQHVNNRMDAFEQKQNDFIEFLNEHRSKAVEAINHQLETKLQEMKTAVESKSDANTKKAIDFLLSIKKGTDEKAEQVLGEFKKHTNPKPQR